MAVVYKETRKMRSSGKYTPDPPGKVPLEKRASLAVSCPATLSFYGRIDDWLPVHKVDAALRRPGNNGE